jgi:hypothetical protein
MKKTTLTTLLLGSALLAGTAGAFAQPYPSTRYYGGPNGPVSAAPYATDGYGGEERQTGYGAGGTAGTHPTGANVGPGRAQMNHSN